MALASKPEYEEFVGVDGCKGGWLMAAVAGDGSLSFDLQPTIEVVLASRPRSLILVDIPIGLRDSGASERLCDLQARKRLKKRSSSVFAAPVRGALSAPDHRTASAVNRKLTEGARGLSRQSWGIAAKIREVNEHLAGREASLPVVREMHPELCFWALNRCRPLGHNKKKKEGYQERIKLLSRHYAEIDNLVSEVRRKHGHDTVQRDDVLDAVVGAITASLGRQSLYTLPEAPEKDSVGLPMEMVYFPLGPEALEAERLHTDPTPSEAHIGGRPDRRSARGLARKKDLGTTQPGYVNRNSQEVIRSTGKPGTDHGQYIYVLRCGECGEEYGANGSDIFQRKCPDCQDGAPGLST